MLLKIKLSDKDKAFAKVVALKYVKLLGTKRAEDMQGVINMVTTEAGAGISPWTIEAHAIEAEAFKLILKAVKKALK